jgi:hypothetical protein
MDRQLHRLAFELLPVSSGHLTVFHGCIHFTLSSRVRQIGGGSERSNSQQSRQYLEHGLHSASIHANPFEPEAMELLIQAGGGLPRTINHLAQRSMEAAAAQSSVDVSAAHVQAGIDRLPWLVNLLQDQSAP